MVTLRNCGICGGETTTCVISGASRTSAAERWLCDVHSDDLVRSTQRRYLRAARNRGSSRAQHRVPVKIEMAVLSFSARPSALFLETPCGCGVICTTTYAPARALVYQWRPEPKARPLTHTTIAAVIDALDASVVGVTFDGWIKNAWHVTTQLSSRILGAKIIYLSDVNSLSTALACGAEITATQPVLEKQAELLYALLKKEGGVNDADSL